jgi:NAD(P)-dependent dehydrogenase (short-subunit alcohol dehydrogenase family)
MSGTSVVVTGGTRGIGQGLARTMLAQGARVTITGTSQASLARGLEALGGAGPDLTGAVCVISERPQVQAVWDHAIATFGVVDVWINNAAISLPRTPLWELPVEEFQRIVNTNLVGISNGDAVAIAGMLAQGHGMVWNMEGFGSGGQIQKGMSPYGSTKYALKYVTKTLVKELKDTPVGIGYMSPGIVATDMLVHDYDGQPEEWERVKKFFNILGDTVEDVTAHLGTEVLKPHKNGDRIEWLTKPKAFRKFASAPFRKRDIFGDKKPLATVPDRAASS